MMILHLRKPSCSSNCLNLCLMVYILNFLVYFIDDKLLPIVLLHVQLILNVFLLFVNSLLLLFAQLLALELE